jgi:hypothetical protein
LEDDPVQSGVLVVSDRDADGAPFARALVGLFTE